MMYHTWLFDMELGVLGKSIVVQLMLGVSINEEVGSYG